jgi:hypothetical protein
MKWKSAKDAPRDGRLLLVLRFAPQNFIVRGGDFDAPVTETAEVVRWHLVEQCWSIPHEAPDSPFFEADKFDYWAELKSPFLKTIRKRRIRDAVRSARRRVYEQDNEDPLLILERRLASETPLHS